MGLYSALVTIPLMLGVTLCFMTPASVRSKLENTETIKQLEEAYTKVKWRLRCMRICGFALLLCLSCFFSLYLVGFGELVMAGTERNWA